MENNKEPRMINHNSNSSKKMSSIRTSTKIIGFYLVFGFAWILLSDQIILRLFTDQDVLNYVQSVKGIFYVLFTALVFYGIIQKQLSLYVLTILDLKNAYEELDLGHRKSVDLENKLFNLAYYDDLTGLPNKILLEQTINQYASEHQNDGMIGFVYFDIDEFRNINEAKGHSVGDHLIKDVANSLKDAIQPPNMLARLGGDEFILAIFDMDDIETFVPLVESFFEMIRKTYILDEDDFFITFSAGVALYPDHGTDYITLMRHADAAVSIAKSKGKDQIVIFDEEMVSMIKQQTEILNQLRQAIPNREFSLHYQPIINLADDKLAGVEALIRWHHPVKGFIPPLEFISLSEKNGYIKEITEWVFKEAASQYDAWNMKGQRFKISINISAIMLMNDSFIPNLNKWVFESKIDCSKIVLEITETAIIGDIEKSIHVLKQIKKMGFNIALDDFGTGYSSLTYLQKLPIDIIKIDRTFISNILPDTEEFHVLKYMIDLAHHLKLVVVAEGIENLEQYNMMKKYFVDFAQGYYFCKPMPQNRVLEYIKSL
jgi:diguanylate cyclase